MKRVVIIDDEYFVIAGIEKLINWSEYGAELVGSARNGIDGLDLILKSQPDIVFTDIRMPGMNGLSMINSAKDQGFKGIFIIFSGYNEFTYAREALSLGVISYIEKPVSIEQINAAMKRACEIIDTNRAEIFVSHCAADLQVFQGNWSPMKSPFVKQLFSNMGKIHQSLISNNEDQLADDLNAHFEIMENSCASTVVISHECLRLMYMALSELGDDESKFVLNVLDGVPPFMKINQLTGIAELKTWLTENLSIAMKWIHDKNSLQKNAVVLQAKAYIDEHYSEVITLQQLASVVHVNSTYLSTLFKKELGISYIKYLTDKRLSEAQKQLIKGERVGIVCREVGFKDGRHFAKLFKEKYGLTPDDIRNRKT